MAYQNIKEYKMIKKQIAGKKQKADPDYENLDNKYEATGYAISEVFKNWKKFLILIAAVLLIAGVILLLLLPGYKCQTETKTFEKTPVVIPGVK